MKFWFGLWKFNIIYNSGGINCKLFKTKQRVYLHYPNICCLRPVFYNLICIYFYKSSFKWLMKFEPILYLRSYCFLTIYLNLNCVHYINQSFIESMSIYYMYSGTWITWRSGYQLKTFSYPKFKLQKSHENWGWRKRTTVCDRPTTNLFNKTCKTKDVKQNICA